MSTMLFCLLILFLSILDGQALKTYDIVQSSGSINQFLFDDVPDNESAISTCDINFNILDGEGSSSKLLATLFEDKLETNYSPGTITSIVNNTQ